MSNTLKLLHITAETWGDGEFELNLSPKLAGGILSAVAERLAESKKQIPNQVTIEIINHAEAQIEGPIDWGKV